MKKNSALVEFTLTTAMLAFWAIACAAAFQGTRPAPANNSAGQPDVVSTAVAQRDTASQPVTIEAALDVSPRGQTAAERI